LDENKELDSGHNHIFARAKKRLFRNDTRFSELKGGKPEKYPAGEGVVHRQTLPHGSANNVSLTQTAC
jgi:hypothetical protein